MTEDADLGQFCCDELAEAVSPDTTASLIEHDSGLILLNLGEREEEGEVSEEAHAPSADSYFEGHFARRVVASKTPSARIFPSTTTSARSTKVSGMIPR